MKMVYPELNLELELSSDRPLLLVIETPMVYTDFLQNLRIQTNGEQGELHLMDREKELRIDKTVSLITDPLLVDCNEKKILNKVYEQLNQLADYPTNEELKDINSRIVGSIDRVIQGVPYYIDFDPELDFTGLLKLYNVRLDYETTSLLERITDYVRLMHQVCLSIPASESQFVRY